MSVVSTTTSAPLGTLRTIASDIKIAHSVFAMPFALLAAFMVAAAPAPGSGSGGADGVRSIDWSRFAGQLVLIVLAMVLARTVAMLANRILDREFDKSNPRTLNRAIPSGKLSLRGAVLIALISAAGFLAVCSAFGTVYENWWPLRLGPFVLAWISAYALLKRFTWLCHIYLGSSLAISPIAAAIAIDPHAITQQPALWLLSAMVLCWVAGFDIIYALQDVDVDRAQRLHSIPAQLGVPRAMWIARTLHALALACLVASILIDSRLHVFFGVGVGIVAALLTYEHLTVARWGTTRIALTFFTLNGVISCVLGLLGIADVLW